MGSIWLHGGTAGYPALDAVVRGTGLAVRLYDGWQNRSRSSGGFASLLGLVVHHTASPSTTSFDSDWQFCAVGNPDAPVASMLLGRDGTVGIHAGGAANHAGKGGPWQCSGGTVPLDSGNSYLLGIEAQNNGVGETWQPVMVDAYVRLCSALCAAYRLDPLRDIVAHFEWAPSRKIDPWGGAVPTPGYPFTGPQSWEMDGFRSLVSTPDSPDEGDDEMATPIVQMIAPQVEGHPEMNKWFARFASGHLVWATNAETTWCQQNGVGTTTVKMGGEQYSNLCKQAGV